MEYTTFNMEQYKQGSARQAMFNDFKILNSFTLENSFFSKPPKTEETTPARQCESPDRV